MGKIQTFLKDYKVVEGDEIISKDVHKMLAEGDESLMAIEVDQERVLRPHTTTTVMDYLKSNPHQSRKIVGVGRALRDTTEDKTHLKILAVLQLQQVLRCNGILFLAGPVHELCWQHLHAVKIQSFLRQVL